MSLKNIVNTIDFEAIRPFMGCVPAESGYLKERPGASVNWKIVNQARIVAVSSGACVLRAGGKEYVLCQNDVFFLRFGESCSVKVSSAGPAEIWWLDLSGKGLDAVLDQVAVVGNTRVIQRISNPGFMRDLQSLVLSYYSNNSSDSLNCLGNAYRILAVLMDECISTAWTAVPYHSDAIMYTGACSLWPSPHPGRHNEIYTNTSRSYAELDFYGSGIRWYGAMNFDCGKADVMIDGVYQTTVDAYSPNRLPRQLLYSNTHLSPGHHIIKIFCNGEANSKATNCDVTLESFWYLSAAPQEDLPRGFKSGVVKKAAQYISLNYSREISVEGIAEELHVSRSYLTSRFSAEMGLTPARYLANIRLSRSKELLSSSGASVAEIASQCGFQDAYYFSRFFKVNTGMTPSQYRRISRENGESGK
jgi:AraC-like DNA-binding protein